MSGNLTRWNNLCSPPKNALKKITFGALNGKHSIDPTWRIKAMTEEYGPVGEGWMYSITSIDYQPVTDNQLMVVVGVGVHIKVDSDWGPETPGVGTAMLINQSKKGMQTDDDAIKKALSDALSVSFKAFGVGADVYMGMMDGDKYQQPVHRESHTTQNSNQQQVKTDNSSQQSGSLDDRPEDTAYLDQCIKYVDSFCDQTMDAFVALKESGRLDDAYKNLPTSKQTQRLKSHVNSVEKFLIEKEGVAA